MPAVEPAAPLSVYDPRVLRPALAFNAPSAWARARSASITLGAALGLCGLCSCAPSPRGGQALGRGYEGDNFYESDGADAVPTPSVVPGAAPGFYGFVTEDQPNAACNGAASADVPRVIDPSLVCPPVSNAEITDFAISAGGDPSNVSLPPDAGFAGGIYFYANGATALSSDVTAGDWHLAGTIAGVSGFGLYIARCKELDASAYAGIEFDLWGQIDAPGALFFYVGTAANQVSDAWIDEHKSSPTDANEPPNVGRCIPIQSRYDGTCREARANVPVTPTPSLVRVTWPDLSDGCPQASVDAAEITSIAWYFPQAPDGGSYGVDLHLDNLRFTVLRPP
jgi:hypothetical protein